MKTMIWTNSEWKKFRANPKRMDEYENCLIEYREATEEEIKELRIPSKFVDIKIPIQVFMNSELLQKKVQMIDLIYNWLERRTVDWYLNIEHIDLNDVPEYLSLEEYTAMKEVWVIFPKEIEDMFENNSEATEE